MCDLCDKIKSNAEYSTLLSKMHQSDLDRVEHSKVAAPTFSMHPLQLYSTIEYPKPIIRPMFEAKVAYAAPLSYFQNLFLNDEKLPPGFSHGATRSIFFLGNRLMLLSKSTASHEGKEFFTSFLLAHFEPEEFSIEITPEGRLSISSEAEKNARNLISGKAEKIKIGFSFSQENLTGKIVGKKNALSSTLLVERFKRAGVDARSWLTSTKYMFDYVVSTAHFSPHPYLLGLYSTLGYPSQADFQSHSLDYFKAHLGN